MGGGPTCSVTLNLKVINVEVQEAATYVQSKMHYQKWLSSRLFDEALERKETSNGRIYYRDVTTGSTTAAFPSEQEASLVPMPKSKTPSSLKPSFSLPSLPTGREMRLTNAKRVHFVDHNTQTNSWDDPRLPSLPTGWVRRWTDTGRPYFVDHNTQTISWDDPRLPSKIRSKS